MTTDGRTDQPTNRQSFENIQTVSIQALTMPKQIVFTGHANQGCAELSKNKFKCFLRSTGNLGRSHKSTPPLDRKVPRPGPVLLSKTTSQTKSCAFVPQSGASRSRGGPKRPHGTAPQVYLLAPEFHPSRSVAKAVSAKALG